jgi:hypothetical protein
MGILEGRVAAVAGRYRRLMLSSMISATGAFEGFAHSERHNDIFRACHVWDKASAFQRLCSSGAGERATAQKNCGVERSTMRGWS